MFKVSKKLFFESYIISEINYKLTKNIRTSSKI